MELHWFLNDFWTGSLFFLSNNLDTGDSYLLVRIPDGVRMDDEDKGQRHPLPESLVFKILAAGCFQLGDLGQKQDGRSISEDCQFTPGILSLASSRCITRSHKFQSTLNED